MPLHRLVVAFLVLSLLALHEAVPYFPGYMMGGRRGFMGGPMRGPIMGGPMRRHGFMGGPMGGGLGGPMMGRYGRIGGFGMGGLGMRPVPF